MAWRGSRNLSLLVSAAGALLLILAVMREAPPARPDESRPADPPTVADPADPVALAAVSLPPPPAPKPAPAPEPAPAPAVTEVHSLKPPPPVEAAPAPPRVIEPLKAPEAKPPVRKIKPLAPTPKPVVVSESEPKPEPKPEPAQVAEIVPLRPQPALPRAEVRAEPAPEAKPAPARPEPETVHVSVRTGGAIASEGRALLRLLEHGSGPTIEIAWPRGTAARSRLYQTLARCYGMRSLLMDGAGNLYIAEGEQGRKWDVNLDRYSGFVRQPEGFVAAEERGEADAIRRYHRLGRAAGVVRIFPRQVDSVLLGGLQQVLGSGYAGTRVIHATYRQEGTRLFVEGIEADGRRIIGRIAFSSVGGCR